jgi:hypothetical protein
VRCELIAIDDSGGEERGYGPQVVARLKRDDPAVDGLFAGEDGEALLALLTGVRKLVVVALHTILPKPSPHHRAVTLNVQMSRMTGIGRKDVAPSPGQALPHIGSPFPRFSQPPKPLSGARHRC